MNLASSQTWMLVTILAAPGFGPSIPKMVMYSSYCESRADTHKVNAENPPQIQGCGRDGYTTAYFELTPERLAYYRRMEAKWRYSASHPWVKVAEDPAPPEPETTGKSVRTEYAPYPKMPKFSPKDLEAIRAPMKKEARREPASKASSRRNQSKNKSGATLPAPAIQPR
jgi:hypothetical protein